MSSTVELYRVFKRDRSGQHRAGFIDAKGVVRIAPVFNGALRFAEGLAAVGDPANEKMGAIDSDGEWVIPARFEKLFWFSDGLCRYKAGPLLGYIDRRGGTKIAPAFHEARDFHEGIAAVRIGHGGARYIRKNGTVIAESEGPNLLRASEGLVPLHDGKSGRFGYIDRKGVIRIAPQFDFAKEFMEGIAVVTPRDRRDASPVAFIDRTGKVLFEPGPYIHSDGFSEGLAVVTRIVRGRGKMGFINREFEEVIPPRFYLVGRFSNGLAPAQLAENKPWGFIDRTGEWAIPPQFKNAEPFVGALAEISLRLGHNGYVNHRGKIVWLDDPYS